MPVFHTKTIESILEPVAQQVSKLVILHEEAEDGNAMPDLARPIQVVKLAVDNLVKVGYDTINSSDDQILKQDMPPALRRVEESSILLLQASEMLRSDPYSAPARKKLIEGSRGILQGTSALLLAFDESEVRKIIRVCKNVLEYLAITEVVDRMEDLVTYVKNLSPVLTRMTKEVDAREKELTHQVHREMLIRSLEQVKNLTPVLISGIKIFITAKQTNQGIPDSQTNRDYVVRKMSDEIHEIIRVLQLTTYDEEEWDADDLAVMKKAQSAIEQKMKLAHDWLADPSALVGSSGDKSLRQILEDAKRIADCCTNPEDRDRILKSVSNLESMSQALNELRQQGKGNSPQAMSLAREMQQQLKELQNLTGAGIMNTERSGIRKPAPTVEGKVDQAQRWLNNPAMDDRGLGEQATRMVVADGRRIAAGCSGPLRSDLLRLCDETEILTNQLADLIAKGQGNSPQAKAIARHLSEKLHNLKTKIQEALVNQVAEDFIDITTPLKQLTEASMVPLGTAGREANFEDKKHNFEGHARKLADTANMVATAGGCRNKKTVEEIFKASKQANDLTPQVMTAAKIVFNNPDNQAAVEHFELLKKQWSDNMERMRNLVDEAVDSTALIKAEEEGILRDTDRVEDGIRTVDSPKIVTNASNIARRANRVLQVAQQEAENSEDPKFVDNVNRASEQLRSTITPMVQCAKVVSMQPQDPGAANNWRSTNQGLIKAVGEVRKAVDVTPEGFRAEEMFPPPPDLSQLHISEPTFTAPPPRRPPPPQLAPSQEFSDIFGLGSPKASVDRPDGSSPIVYNSPHSTIRFYPSSAIPASTIPREVATTLSFNPVTDIRKQVPKKSFVLMSPAASPTLQWTTITVPVNQHDKILPVRAAMKRDQQNAVHRPAPPPVPVAPPIPPPPAYSSYYEDGPPRPPLPSDTMPPRPPPPETDDEDDMNFPIPQENQPIMMAAHALHMEAKQWSSKDNEIIAAAKRMAFLMVKLSQLVRGEGGTKKDLISTAKGIAEASEEVTRLAKKLAAECTDKKMRTNLLQVCERIPTIGTQLKILSTVKATMLGAQGSEEDQEATEMLVGNAQNLMQAVKETVRAAEAASIKIRVDSGYTIRWLRKRPWYT
ncbi:vinculin-like isoform X2 [Ruditapes philippinarum]|uniref:vinculin-like isoform X2 n=1 Tax=Ruditapes philippinarum TaxID=129788 RepID=UPI00295AA9F0|nr:vinculin-like isoform X2 [Ruditapes philippinarum]